MTSPLRAGAAGALTVLMLAAGCGGGGDDDRLSQAEFQQKADAICQKAADGFEAVAKRVDTTTWSGFREYYATMGSLSAAKHKSLAALRPPKDKEDAFNRFKAHVAYVVNQAMAVAHAATRGDKEEINHVATQTRGAEAEGKRLGQELELEVCGRRG